MATDVSVETGVEAGMREHTDGHSVPLAVDDRLAVGIDEAARLVGVGRETIRRAVNERVIPSFKLRDRRLIPLAALRELVADAHVRGGDR